MKRLSKIFNNPLSLILVIASVWYFTRDFIYFTYAILIFITIQVILEKIALGKVSKSYFFPGVFFNTLWPAYINFKRSYLSAMEVFYCSLVNGIDIAYISSCKGPFMLQGLFSLAGPQLDSVPLKAWSNVTYFSGFFLDFSWICKSIFYLFRFS